MNGNGIDSMLERESRSLFERRLVFIKSGYLNNTKLQVKGPERKTSEGKPKQIASQELASEDDLYRYLLPEAKGTAKVKVIGTGFQNLGNTCFLNSALQCLVHTPPLFNYLISQSHAKRCQKEKKTPEKTGANNSFCAMCALESLVARSRIQSKGAFLPIEIIKNIKQIGKQFRAHRQEDCHEFMLGYIDAMQMSAIGFNRKLARPIQETSMIHRIFGGKLRSKITCSECQKDSTILESFLDMSLELKNSSSLEQSLANFCRVERLEGKNKYSCQHCKKLTEASKQFSIDARIYSSYYVDSSSNLDSAFKAI